MVIEKPVLAAARAATARYYGKYRATVSRTDDPQHLGRIQAEVPDVLRGVPTGWALPSAPYAGDGIGSFSVPPRGTGVWIEFEAGDVSKPIWSGCWWGKGQLPADAAGNEPTPEVSVIRTAKQGWVICLDEKQQMFSISDGKGKNLLTIDVQQGQITIRAASKVVVDCKQIELVDGASHPAVFGDDLLQYLQQVVQAYQNHMHPGQTTASGPVSPTPPVPPLPSPSSSINSQKVKIG